MGGLAQALPPTYFLLALVAMTLLHFLWPIHRYGELPLTLIGIAPLALGISLNIAADRQFKRYQTTVNRSSSPPSSSPRFRSPSAGIQCTSGLP